MAVRCHVACSGLASCLLVACRRGGTHAHAMALLRSLRAGSGLLQQARPSAGHLLRHFSDKTPAEEELEAKLLQQLPAVAAEVKDMSGGCGTMYKISVKSDAFKGIGVVKQHQLVTKLLKEDIAQWHGFTLDTAVPSKE